jgi:hypothetical protein
MVPNSIIKPRSRASSRDKQPVQIVLEAAVLPAQRRKALEWQHTDFHVFERDRLAAVHVRADAVGADNLAGHVVAGNLIVPVLRQQHRLARAGADCIERRESVTRVKQRFAFPQTDSSRHEVVDRANRLRIKAFREAVILQIARRALHLALIDVVQHSPRPSGRKLSIGSSSL